MDRVVRTLIKTGYPSGTYSQRDLSVFDKQVTEARIQRIVRRLRRFAPGELHYWKDTNYDVCYRVEETYPSEKMFNKLQNPTSRGASRLKERPSSMHRMLLFVSRLGRFYVLYWNALVWRKGKPVTEFRQEPPDSIAKRFRIDVHRVLKGEGFQHLSPSERREVVRWLKRGNSLIEGPVTVWNCLFSEI